MGAMLPTDAELEKIYGVSRSPVRQALEKLCAEGLIVRGAGRRTTVADKVTLFQWYPATGFREHFEKEWDRMVCKTWDMGWTSPPGEARRFLELEEGEQVFCLLRVRYFDSQPKILMRTYLPPRYALADMAGPEEISGLRELLLKRFGVVFGHIRESVSAKLADSVDAHLLRIPDGSPELEILRYVWDSEKKPLLFSSHYVGSGSWRYEVDFGPSGLSR